MNKIASQKGVALITALFIFSLVAIAAVAMADRQSLDIRRTENILHYDQAYMYALGGEKWAAQILAEVDEDKNVDTLDPEQDPWLNQLPPVPVEGGSISGFIRDVSARFPLNNLVDANGNKNDVYVNAFQRLVDYMTSGEKCGEQSSFNPEFANVVVDWIDRNEQAEPGGAEDLDYLNRERPHRAANQLMASISELRALNNLIAEEYNCFVGMGQNAPLVNTIKANDVPINVNTAPPEVIQSLHPKIDDTILAALIEDREENPHKEIAKFQEKLQTELGLDAKQGETPEETKARTDFVEHMKKLHLSVNSQYFEVTAIAQIGRMQLSLLSLMKRDGNKVTTIQRSIGVY